MIEVHLFSINIFQWLSVDFDLLIVLVTGLWMNYGKMSSNCWEILVWKWWTAWQTNIAICRTMLLILKKKKEGVHVFNQISFIKKEKLVCTSNSTGIHFSFIWHLQMSRQQKHFSYIFFSFMTESLKLFTNNECQSTHHQQVCQMEAYKQRCPQVSLQKFNSTVVKKRNKNWKIKTHKHIFRTIHREEKNIFILHPLYNHASNMTVHYPM